MSFQHSIVRNFSIPGGGGSTTETVADDGSQSLEESIADGVVDQALDFDVKAAAIKSIIMFATTDLTIETNNAGTPDDTIALVAGVLRHWSVNSSEANFITTDITQLFVSNASGSPAKLIVSVIYDPTV